MDQSVYKENVSPFLLHTRGNSLKKQVRFDTPSKSDSRHFDVHEPKPFSYNQHSKTFPDLFQYEAPLLKDISNSNDFQQAINMEHIQDEPILPPFNVNQGKQFLYNMGYNLMPAPSKDLDASLLDSENDSPMKTHKFARGNVNYLASNIRNDGQQISPVNKMFVNDEVESVPNMPDFWIRNNSKSALKIPEGIMSSAAKSKKQFNINSYNSIENSSFFTLPNSKSEFFEECYAQSVKQDLSRPKNVSFKLEQPRFTNNPLSTVTPRRRMERNFVQPSEYALINTAQNRQEQNCCRCSNLNKKETYKSSVVKRRTPIQDMNEYSDTDQEEILLPRSAEEKRLILSKKKNSTTKDEKIETQQKNSNNECEPSVSDLYKIIKIQNEHLQSLQQRVDQLLTIKQNQSDKLALTSNLPTTLNRMEISEDIRSIQKKMTNLSTDQRTDQMHKISIGVMTSFEVVMTSNSINLQNTNAKANHIDEGVQTSFIPMKNTEKYINECVNDNIESCEKAMKNINFLDGIERCNGGRNYSNPVTSTNILTDKKIMSQHDKEYSVRNDDLELSCVETGSLIQKLEQSRSPPLSPQPSLHLNVKDFSDSEDECSQPGVGWTIYNNIMNNVNHILQTPSSTCSNQKYPIKKVYKNKSTRNQYGYPGFNMMDSNISKRVTFEDHGNPSALQHMRKPSSDTSLHMKKLEAKYQINQKPEYNIFQTTSSPINEILLHKNANLRDMRNEMSFSTMEYMQKYQLLNVGDETNFHMKSNKGTSKSPNAYGNNNRYPNQMFRDPARILDITAIKRQSKLL